MTLQPGGFNLHVVFVELTKHTRRQSAEHASEFYRQRHAAALLSRLDDVRSDRLYAGTPRNPGEAAAGI